MLLKTHKRIIMKKINTLALIFILSLSFGCKSDKGGPSNKADATGIIKSDLVYKKNIPAPVVTNVNNAVYTSKEVKINWTSSNSKFLVRVDDVTNANVPVRLYTSDNHLTKDLSIKVADNRKYKIWVHAASSVQYSQDYGDAVYHYFSTGKTQDAPVVVTPTRIAAPTGLSKSDVFVRDGKKYVKFSWNASAGAVGYLVRAAFVGSSNNLVERNDIVALTYDLEVTSGKNYKFWLHAFDKNFNTTSTGYIAKNYSEEANLIVNVASDNACSANSSSTCVIANGSGSQTSLCTNGVLSAPGACLVSTCNSGFEKSILNNNCAATVVPVSGAPVIVSPTANQVVETSGNIVVTWQALSGALSYDYCYAVKNQQSTQKCFSNINQTSASIAVDSGKNYDFWMSAKKANNVVSDVRILTFSTKQVNCNVIAQVFTCPIDNGSGSQTAICTSDGSAGRSACVPTSCNSGFKISGNFCVVDTPPLPVGEIAERKCEGRKNSAGVLVPFPNDFPIGRVRYSSASVSGIGQNCKAEIQYAFCDGKGNIKQNFAQNAFTHQNCTEVNTDSMNFCASGSAQSITQYGITWNFESATACGQFANGDYWVQGPVKIISIAPASSQILNGAEYIVENGSMLNPVPNQAQGLTSFNGLNGSYPSLPYNSFLNVALSLSSTNPLTIQPNNSLLSARDNIHKWPMNQYSTDRYLLKDPVTGKYFTDPKTGQLAFALLATPSDPFNDPQAEKVLFRSMAVLTVVGSPTPRVGSFRPPFGGSANRFSKYWNVDELDLSKLKNYPVVVQGNMPMESYILEATKRPTLEMINHGSSNSSWKAAWNNGKPLVSSFPRRTYGREAANIAAGAGLLLNSEISVESKKRIAINMTQWGLDVFGFINAGMQYHGSGGHQNGRFLPMFLAGQLLKDKDGKTYNGNVNDVIGKANSSSYFQEVVTHGYIGPQHLDGFDRDPGPKVDLINRSKTNARPYREDMIGMPEWSSDGNLQNDGSSSAWSNVEGFNAVWYRDVNGGANCGTVATILLMGGRASVKHEAFIEYYTDRYCNRRMPGGNGAFVGDGNGVSYFTRDMWQNYVAPNLPPKKNFPAKMVGGEIAY